LKIGWITLGILLLLSVKGWAVSPSRLLSIVEKNSPEITAKKKEVLKAEKLLGSLERDFLPKFELNLKAVEFYPYYAPYHKIFQQEYSYGISISSNLVNPQRSERIKRYEIKVEQAKALLNQTRMEVYKSALEGLLKLKVAEEIIKVREEFLKNSEEIYKTAKEKYENQLVLLSDVLKAKAELEDAKAELEKAKFEKEKIKNELLEKTNFALKDFNPEVRLLETFEVPKERKLMLLAEELRPEVVYTELLVKEEKRRVKEVKRSLSPQFTLKASAEKDDYEFLPDQEQYTLSAVLSFPFFDSGKTAQEVKAVSSSVEAKLQELKAKKNLVKKEILNAILAIKKDKEVLKSKKEFVNYAKRAYERTLNEYKLEVSDITALLQAKKTYEEGLISYLNALLQFNLDVLNLYKSAGFLASEVYLKKVIKTWE